jgi:hypothetical protein
MTIALSCPVTADVDDRIEFVDGASNFEACAFEAMQTAMQNELIRMQGLYPADRWKIGELSIDTPDPDPDTDLEREHEATHQPS